jgi:glycosyltransferase involved in cell wall biosynthesis
MKAIRIALVCGNHSPRRFGGSTVSAQALLDCFATTCSVTLVCADAHRDGSSQSTGSIVELGGFPYLSFHPSTVDSPSRLAASKRLREYFRTATNYVRGTEFDVVDVQGPWCENASVVTVRFVYLEYLKVLREYIHDVPAVDPWSETLIELERRTYLSSSVRRYIAVSTKTRDELSLQYNVPTKDIVVIRNGFDPSVFSIYIRHKQRPIARRALGLHDREYCIGYCGNSFIRKNLHGFLESVRPFYSR